MQWSHLWKTQESRNLSQLTLQTESAARTYSRETEIRYNRIYQALNRLANQGAPDLTKDTNEWRNDALFFIDSFQGLQHIAWVDQNFLVSMIAPYQESDVYLNQKANDVIQNPSEVTLMVPVYKGTELGGFILGIIDIEILMSPVLSDISNDYLLQLSSEGKTVFMSENWEIPQEKYTFFETITLQNTAVLNLSFAATDKNIKSKIADASKTLLLSLPFSFITIIAVYFAQKFSELSRLNLTRYRNLFDASQDAIFIINLKGEYQDANPAAIKMIGYSLTELKQMTVDDLRIQSERLPLDERSNMWAEGDTLQISLCHKDGSNIPVDLVTSPIKEGGVQKYVLGIARDTTERIKTEKALKESELKLREAQKMAQLGYWNWDVRTGNVEWSDEVFNIFHLDPMQFTPQIDSILALSPWPGDHERDQELIQKAMETHEKGSYEQRFLRPDKSIGHYSSTFQGNYDDGNLISIVGTVLDITERKQWEEKIRQLNDELGKRVKQRTAQLEAANKELEAFSYSVSHDLRAPLRHIDGFLEMLKRREANRLDSTSKHFLNNVTEATKHMGQLIDDLLRFSRNSRSEIKLRPIDPGTVIQKVRKDLASTLEGRDIIFEVQPLQKVMADSSLLGIVWMNLISNAIKFTALQEAAHIEIGCQPSRDSGDAVFFIRDNGIGFDPQYKDKLFGVFQRLHQQEEFEGTGIGLATVQRIVHRHGGKIWAEAIEGQGATFYFSLKAAA